MLKMLVFHVGADGTNDNVFIEICSDVDSTCCEKKLDSYFNDFKSEWDLHMYDIAHDHLPVILIHI